MYMLRRNAPTDLRWAAAQPLGDVTQLRPSVVFHGRDEDIVCHGEVVSRMIEIESGIAMRYRYSEHGTRQVFMFLFPGDVCFSNCFMTAAADHAVAAVTDVRTQQIEHPALRQSLRSNPDTYATLWEGVGQQEAAMRERISSLENTHSEARVISLLADLGQRVRRMNPDDDVPSLPITQGILADAAGMSPIHFNRMLQKLAAMGVVETKRGKIKLLHLERLQSMVLSMY